MWTVHHKYIHKANELALELAAAGVGPFGASVECRWKKNEVIGPVLADEGWEVLNAFPFRSMKLFKFGF